MIALLIISIVFIAGGLILAKFGGKKARKKLQVMGDMETATISRIIENHQYFLDEFGKNAYREYVEIAGRAMSAKPIKTPWSKREVVYCKSEVKRRYETTQLRTDAHGRKSHEQVTQTEVVSSKEESAESYIDDGTGQIPILFGGKILGLVNTYDDFKSEPGGGDFFLDFSSSNTIGYNYSELSIPTGKELYILAEASDQSGKLMIQAPEDDGKEFIISGHSELGQKKKFRKRLRNFKLAGILITVAGFILLTIFIVKNLQL